MTYENGVNSHNKYVYLLAIVQLGLQMTCGHTKTSLVVDMLVKIYDVSSVVGDEFGHVSNDTILIWTV